MTGNAAIEVVPARLQRRRELRSRARLDELSLRPAPDREVVRQLAGVLDDEGELAALGFVALERDPELRLGHLHGLRRGSGCGRLGCGRLLLRRRSLLLLSR